MPWRGWMGSPISSWLTTGRSRCAATTRWRASSTVPRSILRRARGYVPLAISLTHEAAEPILAVWRGAQERVCARPWSGGVPRASIWAILATERAYRAWTGAHRASRGLAGAHAPGRRPRSASRVSIHRVRRDARTGCDAFRSSITTPTSRAVLPTTGSTSRGDRGGLGRHGLRQRRAHVGRRVPAGGSGRRSSGGLTSRRSPMPGGEAAVREPWRMAAVFLQRGVWRGHRRSIGLPWRAWIARRGDPESRDRRGLNAPPTSSAGRLFDAVASLLGFGIAWNFEAQAAMELEALAKPKPAESLHGRISEGMPSSSGRRTSSGRGRGPLARRPPTASSKPLPRNAGRGDREHVRAPPGALCARSGRAQRRCVPERPPFPADGRRDSVAPAFRSTLITRFRPNDGGLALGQAAIAARFREDRSCV